MTPTQALRNEAMALLAADAATLGAALATHLHLNMNNVSPTEQSVLTDFVEATFTGFAALHVTAGAQPEGFDPNTNDSVIDLSPPAGGFRWVTGNAVGLPQTIYGYYLTDNADAVLLAAQKLDTPFVLTAGGQVIDLGDVRLRLPANSIT